MGRSTRGEPAHSQVVSASLSASRSGNPSGKPFGKPFACRCGAADVRCRGFEAGRRYRRSFFDSTREIVNSAEPSDPTLQSLARRIDQAARIAGRFVLRSGQVSDTYFDKYRFEAEPELLRAIAESLAPLVPAGTEVLAGLEMGGIPIVSVLSQVTGLPAAFIRKEAKQYGTRRYAEGAMLEGRRFVLVEDVVSSGGAILDALAKLTSDGLRPTLALCVIDRGTGGREALAAAGLPLVALFTSAQIEAVR
jgi:orotate phosphoribosyltransferase